MTSTASIACSALRASAVRRRLALSSALGATLVVAVPAWGQTTDVGVATPGQFSGGASPAAAIIANGANGGDGATVTLRAEASVVNWASLNIAASQTLAFNSNAAGRVAVLNRVTGATDTTIAGSIVTGGTGGGVEVWISNPNGITFNQASGQSINTQGFVATTLPISGTDFIGGTAGVSLAGPANSSVAIDGTAIIRTNGQLLALVAPVIRVGGSFTAGTGAAGTGGSNATAAFVTATDVTLQEPGNPLAVTIVRGTNVGGTDAQLEVNGSVAGQRAFFVLSAQGVRDTLLNVGADVAVGAAVGANGVIVLNGNSTTNADAVAGTANANRIAFDPAFLGLTDLSGGGSVALTGAIDAGGSTVVLGARRDRFGTDTGPGAITSTGGITAGSLSAVGGTGISLTGANAIGTTTRLTSTNGAVTLNTTGALTIGGEGAAGTAIQVNAAGALTVATGAEVDASGAVSLTGQGIAISGAIESGGTGNVTLNARTGALDLASTIDVAGNYLVTAGTFAGGALDLGGAVSLDNGSDVSITDTAGGFTLADGFAVDNALSVSALNGGVLNVSNVEAGTTLALSAGSGITLTGGTLSAGDAVTVTGPTTLAGATTVTTGVGPSTDRIAFVGPTSTINGAFALTATSNGTTTFGGAIGQTAALASLDVTDGGAALGGSVRTTGNQTYAEGVALTGAATLAITGAGGVLDLGSGLTGNNNDLTLDLIGVATVDGDIDGVNDLRVDSTTGGTTAITGTISTTGTQVYADGVTLVDDVTLTSSGTGAAGAITLATIAGAGNALTVNTAGVTSFGGVVSGVSTLQTNAAGTTAINADITTTVAQNYLGAATVGGAAPVTLDGGNGIIGFGGTLGGPQALTIAGAATTATFGGAVSGLASLTTNAGTTAVVNGGAIGTTGAQTYDGVLQLGGAAGSRVTLTGGGAVSLAGEVTGGGRDLTLDFAGLTTIGSNVTGVDDLATGNGGITAITGSITTTGTQTYNDAVALTAAGPITLTASGATFAGTVDGAQALTVTAAGSTTFGGAVGGTTRLLALAVDGGGTTAVNGGSVLTSGDQVYAEAVTVGAASATFGSSGTGTITFASTLNASGANGAVVIDTAGTSRFAGAVGTTTALGALTVQGGGTTEIVGGAITTTGTQSYGSAVVLASPMTTLTTTAPAGNAVFAGGVAGGGNSLMLNVAGTATLANFAGLQDLVVGNGLGTTLPGTIETAGIQSYGAPTTLGGDVVLRSAGVGAAGFIGFANTLTGAQALLVETQGTTQFGGSVSGLTSLSTDAGGGTVLAADVSTSGSQSYGDLVTLAGPAGITLTSTTAGGGGDFAGGLVGAGRDLTLNFAGTTAIGGGFSGVDDLVIGGGGITTLSGTISTTGTQNHGDAVQLVGATVVTSSGVDAAGAITFAETVTGAQALTVNTAGVTRFGGGGTGLASITTDAAGLTVLNGTLATSGAQSFGDAVQLDSAVTVTSGLGGGTDAVRFGGTVTGAQALTVTTAGRTVFDGAVGVGGAGVLASLLVDGGGVVALNGGAVTTTGAQTYDDAVRLGADTVLTGSGGSFASGLNGGGNDLTLNFANATSLNGFVNIGDLVVIGATQLSGLIDTVGGQRYGAVTLTGTTTLRSGGGTGAGAIELLGAIDGAEALTVTTAGTTIFGGAIGGITPLSSLTVNGTGPIAINGGLVATTGAQRFAGAAALGMDTRLTTAGGDVSFAGTVDGMTPSAQLLSISTGSGAVSVGRAVGGTTALGGLALRSGSASFAGGNRVGTLAASISAGGLSFGDAGALTVGSVDGVTGVTATGPVDLTATQALTNAADVTGAGVALTGTGVTQTAGTIDALSGDLTVDGDDGALQFAGALRSAGGTVALIDASSVALGQVDAGAAGTLRLGGAGADAITGTVAQNSGTTIQAQTLTGVVGGSATLLNDGNSIARLAAFSANGFALHNEGALDVAGAVDAGSGSLLIDLDAGALRLNAPLTAASGVVRLIARDGAVSQSAAGLITADTLAGSSVGGAGLGSGNAVSTLAGWTNTGAGGFTFATTRALTLSDNIAAGSGALALTAQSVEGTGRTLTGGAGLTVVGRTGDVRVATLLAGGSGAGDLSVAAGGVAAIGTATSSNGALGITAGGALSLGTGSSTGAVTLVSGGEARTGRLVGGAGVGVTAAGAASINGGSAGADFIVNAGGIATIEGAVAARGAYRVTGQSLVLGNGATLQQADGGIALVSTGGGISGSAGLTLASNADGVGGEAMLIDATGGAIALSAATLTAGTSAQRSDIGIATRSAATPVALGTVTARALAGISGGAATGGIATAGDVSASGPVTLQRALAISSTGGAITLNTVVVTDAGAGIQLGTDAASGGPITAARLEASGVIDLRSRGAVGVATVAGGSLFLTSASGSVSLGQGAASGAVTLSAAGDLTIATGLTSGGTATLTATGSATLGQTTAGGAVAITANGVTAGRTVAGAGLTVTSSGALNVQSAQAGGDARFDAATNVSLGTVTAGNAAAITIHATDAAITGVQSAARVSFVNRTLAGNAFKLGNGTSSGGFQLSQTEVNLVEAGTLTFDGGAGNIELGALAFDGDAGRSAVNLLSTGRIDVLDAVTGGGAGRSFVFGGTAASAEAKAGVIQVAATAAGGGRLLFETANLDLRGDRIGVGQLSGFLEPLGFSAGGTPASNDQVAQLYVGNANSSLYNSTFGGPAYNPSGLTFLSANSLTVRYTNYALFQNSGAPGVNAGVALGGASPVNSALVLQGSGVNTANSFALFGTINGISGSSTAVLGPTIIGINGANLASTRLNGCIVGSGAGCLTAVVAQPVLNVFDASRLDVFRSADDLALPFDPIIGTNNEALFSGISLGDVPITATECAAGVSTPECAQSQGERK